MTLKSCITSNDADSDEKLEVTTSDEPPITPMFYRTQDVQPVICEEDSDDESLWISVEVWGSSFSFSPETQLIRSRQGSHDDVTVSVGDGQDFHRTDIYVSPNEVCTNMSSSFEDQNPKPIPFTLGELNGRLNSIEEEAEVDCSEWMSTNSKDVSVVHKCDSASVDENRSLGCISTKSYNKQSFINPLHKAKEVKDQLNFTPISLLTRTGAPDSKYQAYKLDVDPTDGDRAAEIPLYSFARPHMRAFHLAWMSFFVSL